MSVAAKSATTGFDLAAFESFLTQRDEPKWLIDFRRAAWEKFAALPMPARTDEEWRRTDLRTFHLDRFAPPAGGRSDLQPADALLTHGVDLAGRVTTVDSRPAHAEVDPALAKQGVLFGSLDQLANEHPDRVRPHLMTRAVDPAYDKFAALHAAFWSGGTLLYVPRGVKLDRPLHTHAALSPGAADFGHTLVVLEEGAEATLLAECSGGQGGGLHCGAVELIAGAGARLRYVNLQNWSHDVWHFAHQRALVDRDARLWWTIGALGGRLAKVNQHVELIGEYADARVHGVMFTEGKQHLSYHTLQHHRAANCHSDLLYKGALQDHSRLVWRGMIKVDPKAQRTDGYQRNDNLMLTDGARADSIPGLEIEADDVRCTHGSTTGRVDDQQVFYARCRGLTRKEAVRMIVAGFFQQVFDRIDIEPVREALGEAIGRRIREYD